MTTKPSSGPHSGQANSDQPPLEIIILGGGSAGWLTATILASEFRRDRDKSVNITLVQSPNVPIVGVGEGTWPSLRTVLHKAGIKEADFLRACSASFKQGSKFLGWANGKADDYYYHPFDRPASAYTGLAAQFRKPADPAFSFVNLSGPSQYLCERALSPKLLSSREYAGVMNYGYHLDAGNFSSFLQAHCINRLGVTLISDHMIDVRSGENGDIDSIILQEHGPLKGHFFIDCTGFRSLLLGQHYGVGLVDKSHILPINSALAVQLPYNEEEAIKSTTWSTAQTAGWIWDISLRDRRGIGHVYCKDFISDQLAAEQLGAYLNLSENALSDLAPRKIDFTPGIRERFWTGNCVAVGLSAGFLEPLEATAIILIEAAANSIADVLKQGQLTMAVKAEKFNRDFHRRWDNILDFLKFHYALSLRSEPFWKYCASEASFSPRLKTILKMLRSGSKISNEDLGPDMFPLASYQYVFYGMSAEKPFPEVLPKAASMAGEGFENLMTEMQRKKERFGSGLLDNQTALALSD